MSGLCRFSRCVVAACVALVACKKGDRAADTPIAAVVVAPDTGAPAVAVAVPAGAPVELQVAAPPGAGVILADAGGRAVYIIEGGCTTPGCMASFTPVPGTAMAKQGDTAVKAAMAGSTTRPDGSKQATYNGQPLYYSKGDQTAGDIKGQGKKAGGGTAHLVSPAGTAVTKK
jgi:predicted lipoprotein with Yx(FWY)xxD motif